MIEEGASGVTKVTSGSVVSRDGTEIGYSRFGNGSPVVVCHGAFTLAEHGQGFARELSKSHTVYLYDRRGRGRSPDTGKSYSFSAELDDLAAMVPLAGPETAILGHSFGGGLRWPTLWGIRFRGDSPTPNSLLNQTLA